MTRRRRSRSVLVADDSPPVRAVLQRLLEASEGFEFVGEACDGHEVVRLAEELQPDVVLLDGRMPGLSGTEAIPLLRDVAPRAKVVMFSGADDRTVKAALAAGAVGFIEKGTASKSLGVRLSELLDRSG